jgi:ATP-binding cassette, subfamily G (WHITE), member 2, PDR
VELLYQIVIGILVYACYYYLVFGYHIPLFGLKNFVLNVTRIQSSERQVLILLFLIEYFVFASTFAYMIAIALPDAQTAGTVVTLLFSMTMIFNG